METIEIISPRQLQRDYKTIFNRLKRTKKPIYVGYKGKAEATILPGFIDSNNHKTTSEIMDLINKTRCIDTTNSSGIAFNRLQRDERT